MSLFITSQAKRVGMRLSRVVQPHYGTSPVELPTGPVNTLELQVAMVMANPIWIPVATNSVPQSGPLQFYRLIPR